MLMVPTLGFEASKVGVANSLAGSGFQMHANDRREE